MLTNNLLALYGLLGSGSIDLRLKKLLASKRASLGMWISGMANKCRGRTSAAQSSRLDLTAGTRVFHEGRGKGQVVEAKADATGSTVYLVHFEGGAVHSYSGPAAQRLRLFSNRDVEPGVGPDVVTDSCVVNCEGHLELDTAPASERHCTAAGGLYVDSSSDVDSENSDETASRMSIRVGHVDLSPFHIGSESGAQHSLAELVIQAVAWRQTDLAELYPSAAGGLTGDRPGAFGDSASIAARTPRAESVASDGMLHADQLPGIGLMAAAHWHYDRALSALLASGTHVEYG